MVVKKRMLVEGPGCSELEVISGPGVKVLEGLSDPREDVSEFERFDMECDSVADDKLRSGVTVVRETDKLLAGAGCDVVIDDGSVVAVIAFELFVRGGS